MLRERFGGQVDRNPLRFVERESEEKRLSGLLEKMNVRLHEEADALREAGFPVDADCRIDPEAFEGVVNISNLKSEKKKETEKESEWKSGDSKSAADIGSLLEASTTVAFNNHWFEGRLLKVRTSKFDDYHHGVDQLIIDRDTFQIVAAVDSTVSPDFKATGLRENINKGKTVKFGVLMDKQGVRKDALEGLPYLVLTITPVDLLALSEAMLSNNEKVIAASGKKLLKQLRAETEAFERIADMNHRAPYASAKKILQEIEADMAKTKEN